MKTLGTGRHQVSDHRLIGLTLLVWVSLLITAVIAFPILAQAQATDALPTTLDLRQATLSAWQKQDFDKAIESYKALLAQNPPDALSIKVDLGLVYKAKKDYANAMPLFTEVAASQDKRKAEAMFYIEDCCCELGKVADAVTELTRAYNECPDARASVLGRRSMRLEALGQFKAALADVRELLANYPNDDAATYAALRVAKLVFQIEGKTPALTAALDQAKAVVASEVNPDKKKALKYELRDTLVATEQWDDAIALGQSMLSEYPQDATNLKIATALTYKAKKDYAEAKSQLETLAASAKGDQLRDISFWILDCLTEADRNSDALAYLDEMLAGHPEWKAQILYRQAACLGDLERIDECVACWQRLFEECPETEEATTAQVAKAELLAFSQRKPAEARTALEQFAVAHPQYPDMIPVRRALAFCSYIEGKYDEAATLYTDALKLPDTGTWHPFLMYMVGDSYIKAGRIDAGLQAWDRLKAAYPDADWTKVAEEKAPRVRARQEAAK